MKDYTCRRCGSERVTFDMLDDGDIQCEEVANCHKCGYKEII